MDKLDIVYLSETYLNREMFLKDFNLEMSSYTYVRFDHPSNTEHYILFLNSKDSLAFKVIFMSYIQ